MVVVLEELVVFNGEAQIADSSRRPDDPLYGPYYTSWSQDLALTAMILHLEAGLSAGAHPRSALYLKISWAFCFFIMAFDFALFFPFADVFYRGLVAAVQCARVALAVLLPGVPVG